MSLALYNFRTLRLPDRAGDLQAQRATAALVEELGDRYDHYHDYLAEELAAQLAPHGRRPEPDHFDTAEAFLAAWGYIHEIVLAEVLLRNARAHRVSGRPLDASADVGVPLVDARDRLVRQPADGSARPSG